MTAPHRIFDRELLTRRRDRIAGGISAHDFLLQRVAGDFEERLLAVRRSFATVLDLGAHHGVIGRRIRTLPGVQRLISSEMSPQLLEQCAGEHVLADEEALPFADGALDLVVSGLALQQVNDLPGTLAQIRRALRPDGLLLAAVLGGTTLRELREAFLLAEDEIQGGASPRVAPFADVRDFGALLQRAGFALPVADADLVTVAYASPLALMKELAAMGCSNVLTGRRRAPLRRGTLARACALYQERFSRPDGRITATFEIITLTGWVPHESQQKPLRPGSARMRLADALKREEKPAAAPAPKPGQTD